MTTYIHTSGELKNFDEQLFAAWVANGNPKADGWSVYVAPENPPTPPPQEPPRYRVSKDTILLRVEACGKLNDLMTLLESLPKVDQFKWNNFAWFFNDNPLLVQGCVALGMNPEVVLAVDENMP